MTSYQTIVTNLINQKLYITLNRPEKRNAFNSLLVEELTDIFSEANSLPNCKLIILQAEGKVFSAGADLAYLQQLQNNSFVENFEDSSKLKNLFKIIYEHSKIVIAKIQGHAIAGGCGLATVCDFSFSVEEAQFGYTEVKIGFIPAIVSIFLLRKIGEGKAKELLFSGKLISAKEAQNFGLINYVEKTENLNNAVENFADELINSTSNESLKLTKTMIAKIQELSLDGALEYAAEMNAKARATKDCKLGIEAFLNKTPIQWGSI